MNQRTQLNNLFKGQTGIINLLEQNIKSKGQYNDKDTPMTG